MKRILFAVFFILVLFSGCKTESENSDVIVSLETSGEITVQPNIAEFVVTASCIRKDIKISKSCVTQQLNSVYKKLEELDIKKDDFHSAAINLNKEYIWKNNSQVFNGYRSSITTTIIIRDLKKLDGILSELLVQNDLSISNLSYSHSEIDSLANDAYIKALDNSRILAGRIQTNLNAKGFKIIKISNTQEPVIPPLSNPEFERKAEVRSLDTIKLNVGALILRRQLKVQYLLEK